LYHSHLALLDSHLVSLDSHYLRYGYNANNSETETKENKQINHFEIDLKCINADDEIKRLFGSTAV
jgi:hypothetical protein